MTEVVRHLCWILSLPVDFLCDQWSVSVKLISLNAGSEFQLNCCFLRLLPVKQVCAGFLSHTCMRLIVSALIKKIRPYVFLILHVHATSLANSTLSATDSLTGSQNEGNIPFSLCTEDSSHIILETSVFWWFWIKVYFPTEVVLSHAKYFLAWVQLAISHCSVQFTGFAPVATSPWPEAQQWQAKLSLSSVFAGVLQLNVQPLLSAACAAQETGAHFLGELLWKGHSGLNYICTCRCCWGKKNSHWQRVSAEFDQRKKHSNKLKWPVVFPCHSLFTDWQRCAKTFGMFFPQL